VRTLGLIGGMSYESTLEYYRLLNQLVNERLGGLHSARCLLASVDFAEIDLMMEEDRWADAGESLAADAKRLEESGAEIILLCTNTLHKVAPAIEAAVSVPFLHIADAAAARLREAGVEKVGLLATAYTMEQDFYRDRLAGHGLEVLIPGPERRPEIHRIIFDELCLGQIEQSSRAYYIEAIEELAAAGAEAILLGCTEIAALVSPEDSPLPLFDTTRIHVEAAVEAALADGSEA
jgi:aspartate racemase